MLQLSQLPDGEPDFLLENSSRILAAADGNLEGILAETRDTLGDVKYGWEEAILSRKFFRFPGQVREQIFCSENALKNWLLFKTMGFPVMYAIFDEFDNTGMNHEAVLIPIEDKVYFVDWKDSFPAVIAPTSLQCNGNTVTFKKMTVLPDHEVIPRVMAAQRGDSFLEAIKVGQLLYTSRDSEGELRSLVKYDPEKGRVSFLFTHIPFTGSVGHYVDRHIYISPNGVREESEWGIACDSNYLNTKRLAHSGKDSVFKPLMEGDVSVLPEDVRLYIGLDLLYDRFLDDRPDGLYYASKSDRTNFLARLRETKEDLKNPFVDVARIIVGAYDNLRKHYGIKGAERYLDYNLFQIINEENLETQEKIDQALGDHLNMDGTLVQTFYHSAMLVRRTAQHVSRLNQLGAQQILVDTVAEKEGHRIDYTMQADWLDFFDSLKGTGPGEF